MKQASSKKSTRSTSKSQGTRKDGQQDSRRETSSREEYGSARKASSRR